MNLYLIGIGLIVVLGIRTLGWHLQCWQLREYRIDRMKAWINTQDGKQYFIPWFFRGLLPRPKLSGRICLIIFFTGLFGLLILMTGIIFLELLVPDSCHVIECNEFFPPEWHPLLALIIWERTIWLQTGLAVMISGIPVKIKKQLLFKEAKKIIDRSGENLIKIGITGSFGKSSTKELLAHLLKSEFGDEQVLYNPANNNTEVAIARLIIDNQDFFNRTDKRFLVIETGAYRKGEIATVTNIISANYGILTGLNQQHIELFGSIQNIREAKFELAEGTQDVIFFNGDNPYLVEIFEDRDIKASKIPISFKAAKNIDEKIDKTHFEAFGQRLMLPWPGKFFIQNALLALECSRECGVKRENFTKYLAALPPLKRALSLEVHPQGFTLLKDTYSANPDGVLNAIEHLKNFSGRRIFVSIPLRELGGDAQTVHAQIFEKLKSLDAIVYWQKNDFFALGQEILGDSIHSINASRDRLKQEINHLGKNDVVLLESKLSSDVMNLFK